MTPRGEPEIVSVVPTNRLIDLSRISPIDPLCEVEFDVGPSRRELAMTMAAFVRITCQGCGLTSAIPVEALLVSVAVEDSSSDSKGLGGNDGTGLELDDRAATGAWICDACHDLVAVPLEWPAVLTLVAEGAILLDDASEARPAHPERSAGGNPLSRDDLLALHELLISDSWFDRVTSTGIVSP